MTDVKPENFLFQDESPNSPLKMVDFGKLTVYGCVAVSGWGRGGMRVCVEGGARVLAWVCARVHACVCTYVHACMQGPKSHLYVWCAGGYGSSIRCSGKEHLLHVELRLQV